MRGHAREAQRNSRNRNDHDADQNRAADFARHQDGDQNQPERGQTHLRIGRFSQAHKRGRVGHDDFGVAQPDESDEETDARGRSVLQAIGNVVDDVLADIGERQNQKERAGKKTTPSAVCQGTPRPRTIEYVKYAFSDIPGASAIG